MFRGRFLHGGLLVSLMLLAFASAPSRGADAKADPLVAYNGKLQSGFADFGWGPRTLNSGPAKVDVGDWKGWILGIAGTDLSVYSRVQVSLRHAKNEAPLVGLRVTREGDLDFPLLPLAGSKPDSQGWQRYEFDVAKLNPKKKAFDRLMLVASRSAPVKTFVEFDRIALTGLNPATAGSGSLAAGAVNTAKRKGVKSTDISVDCSAERKTISPLIYGNAFNPLTESSQTAQFTMGATTRRWGGDWSTRYNWEHGNAWNPGFNWFWGNQPVSNGGNAWQAFFDKNASARMTSTVSVPTLGWVAKDTKSYSFSVAKFGAQEKVSPDNADAGNGVRQNGDLIPAPKPETTSIKSSPESVARWVKSMTSGGWTKKSALSMVILDNEPDLWFTTHRDIHPSPATYDEVTSKAKAYAAAIRAADPKVKIAGPASWGWWGYFYSAADHEAGFDKKPDRRSKGDVPFLEYYLQELVKEEARLGIRLLDVLDVHYYPQTGGVLDATGGQLDQKSNEARIRATRSLWDRGYEDDSWIDEKIYLIPRMREIIQKHKPGIGLSIGEYNFGGERHISGAIAQAEALGRFGQGGVYSAYLWTHPVADSEQYWGFRAFRNYDRKGSHFLPISVKASSDKDLSVFASTDESTGQQVLVVINKSSSTPFAAKVTLNNCGTVSSLRKWTYAGGPQGFVETPEMTTTAASASTTLDPWTIQVLRFD